MLTDSRAAHSGATQLPNEGVDICNCLRMNSWPLWMLHWRDGDSFDGVLIGNWSDLLVENGACDQHLRNHTSLQVQSWYYCLLFSNGAHAMFQPNADITTILNHLYEPSHFLSCHLLESLLFFRCIPRASDFVFKNVGVIIERGGEWKVNSSTFLSQICA